MTLAPLTPDRLALLKQGYGPRLHAFKAATRGLLELLEDSSGKRYPRLDRHTALASATTDSTSGLPRLSPPAKDDFHLIRFTMEDILAVDFVSGEIYVQKVN